MKNTLVLFLLTLFFVSCSKTTEKIPESFINTGTLNTGNIIINDDIISNKKLTIEDKMKLFITEKDLISILEKREDGDLLEEIPRINSYYTDNAFYEYYLFDSISNNDIKICNNIKGDDKKKLCILLFNNSDNKNEIIKLYLAIGEEEIYAINIYEMFKSLKDINSTNCNVNSLLLYLSCKKIKDKNVDVKDLFIKYSILEYSKYYDTKIYYNDILTLWGVDESFKNIVEKNIIKNIDDKYINE